LNGCLWPFALVSVAEASVCFGEAKPTFVLRCNRLVENICLISAEQISISHATIRSRDKCLVVGGNGPKTMNWDAISAVGEIIGAVAVVISLIYLSFQVKQNTSAMRSLTHQEHFNAAQDFNTVIASNPEFAKLIVKADDDNESLTPSERIQLSHHYINLFTLWHSAFENQKSGLLGDSGWRVWDGGCKSILISQRAMRDTWNTAGQIYGPDFSKYVNTTLEKYGSIAANSGVWDSEIIESFLNDDEFT